MKAPNQVQQKLSDMLRGTATEQSGGGTHATPAMWKQSSSAGLPVPFVLSFLELKIQKKELYAELFVYIPFVCMFVYFYLGGRDITDNHYVTQGIKDLVVTEEFPDLGIATETLRNQLDGGEPIHIDTKRSFIDITNSDMWYQWFGEVFVRGMFDCEKEDVSRSMYAPRGKTYGIGAVRIRSMEMKNKSCNVVAEQYNNSFVQTDGEFYDPLCYAYHSKKGEETEPKCPGLINPTKITNQMMEYRTCARTQLTTGDLGIYHCGGYTVEIPFNATCRSALQLAELLQTECKLLNTIALRFVTVEWFMYTPSLDTFQSGKMFYEVTASGQYIPSTQLRTFQLWTANRFNQSLFDVAFLIIVLVYLGRLILHWFEDFKREGSIGHFLMDVWNVMDFVNIATFFAVFVIRLLWISASSGAVDAQIFPANPEYPDLEQVLFYFLAQVYANSFNCVITFLKFLQYLRVSERLGILTRTFASCSQALLGVLFIFFLVVLAYALAGIAMFGSNLKQFSNMNTALATMMRMLLGQFDYNAMKEENPVLAAWYFWTFIILGLFLLLNFVLAVVSNAFGDLSSEQALVPLDVLIVRQIDEIRQQMHPRMLKKLFLLYAKKKTRAGLLQEMIRAIEEHMKFVDAPDPTAVFMYYGDFRTWLPEILCNDLGERYIAIMWDNMKFEYELSRQTDDYQEQRQLGESIADAIKTVCDPGVAVGSHLLTQVDAIESNVRHVVALLRRHKQQQETED